MSESVTCWMSSEPAVLVEEFIPAGSSIWV